MVINGVGLGNEEHLRMKLFDWRSFVDNHDNVMISTACKAAFPSINTLSVLRSPWVGN